MFFQTKNNIAQVGDRRNVIWVSGCRSLYHNGAVEDAVLFRKWGSDESGMTSNMSFHIREPYNQYFQRLDTWRRELKKCHSVETVFYTNQPASTSNKCLIVLSEKKSVLLMMYLFSLFCSLEGSILPFFMGNRSTPKVRLLSLTNFNVFGCETDNYFLFDTMHSL